MKDSVFMATALSGLLVTTAAIAGVAYRTICRTSGMREMEKQARQLEVVKETIASLVGNVNYVLLTRERKINYVLDKAFPGNKEVPLEATVEYVKSRVN